MLWRENKLFEQKKFHKHFDTINTIYFPQKIMAMNFLKKNYDEAGGLAKVYIVLRGGLANVYKYLQGGGGFKKSKILST